MAAPNPAQQFNDEINNQRSKINTLQENVRLADIRDRIGDLQTTVNGMGQKIAGLRQRGYVFEKNLEGQAAAFLRQWNTLYPSLMSQVNSQASTLEAALRPLEIQVSQLAATGRINPIIARPALARLKSEVDTLDSKVEAAENAIEGMYAQFNSQVSKLGAHLAEIEWMLKQLSEATFQLLPTEGGIMAVKAVWCKTGKEQKTDPEGVLFLTDQRLFFEQKEEIATKKVLFIATEKQKIHSLQLEVEVVLVDKVTISKAGLLKNEDHIDISFRSGAPLEMAHFHIWQDCATWQSLIHQARNKDFDMGRAVEVDQAAVDRVKAAPAQCPGCGANISKPILRGQESIKCEYCGYVIRL